MAEDHPEPHVVAVNPRYDEAAVRDLCRRLPALEAAVVGSEVVYTGRNLLFRHRWRNADWVVKCFRLHGPWQRLVYRWRRGKAERSYTYALLLDRLGVATPEPLAFASYGRTGCCGAADGYYVCRHLDGYDQVRVLHDADHPRRSELVARLGAWAADLHRSGVMHRDFTVGNVLFDPTAADPVFHLVDVNRMRFGRVSVERGVRSLIQLEQCGRMGELLLDAYCAGRGIDPDGLRSFYADLLRRHLAKFEVKNRTRAWRRRMNPFSGAG